MDESHHDGLNFTIHDYQNTTHLSRKSMSTLIAQTSDLLTTSICGNLGWHSIKHKVDKESVKSNKKALCYMLAKPPPIIPPVTKVLNLEREWGVAVTEDEVYRTSDLDDFIGTNLKHLLAASNERDIPDTLSSLTSRIDGQLDISQPTFKKRRLNHESLRVIPQPHMIPSPFLESTPSPQCPPFDRHATVILPSYTAQPLLDDTHVAWLIPIRGTPPWDGCSPGTLLNEPEDLIASISSKTEIVWTKQSLLKFWEFLLDLSKSANLGALGLSFHASETDQRAKTTLTDHRLRTFSTPVSTSHSVSEIGRVRSTLATLDYIKIYHDARIRLHLRRVIDEWSCDFPAVTGKIVNVMPLESSRLVLLDDISQAILIL